MAAFSSKSLAKFLVILIAISFHLNFIAAARILNPKANTEFVRSSCSTTTYPELCYSSLSVHATKINASPKLLANAALNVTLLSAKSTSYTMLKLSKGHGMKPREVGAMQDCVEELADAVDELSKSIDEMSQANSKGSNFGLMINDIQTWVSAALTDETTCSDGFSGQMMDGTLKSNIRGQIVDIAHMTSNALALVNHYATLHG
ncbi:Plant invertase/pectin methylesterase inhibitor superfamily protein [Euphorbia peplus]|nr:Plant invertase/pectin methylesterase inhibitor superfamily protein [Euphorbia peplus]